MNLKKLLFLTILLPIFILCKKSKEGVMVVSYSFGSLDTVPYWDKGFEISTPVKIDYSNPDTVYYTFTRADRTQIIRKYIVRETNKYNSEPKEIRNHRLIGVFREKESLPGFTILIYVNKDQGVLQKIYTSPNHLFLSDYDAVINKNPFKDTVFRQSTADTLRMTKSFRVTVH